LPDVEAAKLRGADRITQMMQKRKQKKRKKPNGESLRAILHGAIVSGHVSVLV